MIHSGWIQGDRCGYVGALFDEMGDILVAVQPDSTVFIMDVMQGQAMYVPTNRDDRAVNEGI